jgi:hypothetical protein
MATEFCQKCKQSHPGRLCDYDERGECAETIDIEQEKETTGAGASSTTVTEGAPSNRPKE